MRFFANERSIYCNFENRKKKFSFDFFWAKINNPQNCRKMGNFRST